MTISILFQRKVLKRIIAIIILLFLPTSYNYGEEPTESQKDSKFLYLRLKSGEIVKYSLAERPIIRFEDKNVTVENDSYLISDIEKYTFSMPSNESGTGITNAETIAAFVNDNIHLSSEYALNYIHIVDLQGMEYPVAPRLTRGTGYVEINLQDLSPGIYILTIPDHSIKFIKK